MLNMITTLPSVAELNHLKPSRMNSSPAIGAAEGFRGRATVSVRETSLPPEHNNQYHVLYIKPGHGRNEPGRSVIHCPLVQASSGLRLSGTRFSGSNTGAHRVEHVRDELWKDISLHFRCPSELEDPRALFRWSASGRWRRNVHGSPHPSYCTDIQPSCRL